MEGSDADAVAQGDCVSSKGKQGGPQALGNWAGKERHGPRGDLRRGSPGMEDGKQESGKLILQMKGDGGEEFNGREYLVVTY